MVMVIAKCMTNKKQFLKIAKLEEHALVAVVRCPFLNFENGKKCMHLPKLCFKQPLLYYIIKK